MKKYVVILVTVMVLLLLVSCGNEAASDNEAISDSDVMSENSSSELESEFTEQSNITVDIHDLVSGDEVSIVGQCASSTLVNGNTVWIQVQQPDGTFVIYHCQMKDEFIEMAGEIKMLDVVKVHGLFLSIMDLEQENTAIMITLYDCEIL